VFVCIEGTDIDGHKFAADALQSGAVMLIVTKDLGFKNQIIVEDTRETYAVMCANWFGNPAKDLKIIGVTGTNGKTSVSCFLKAILDFCGYKTGLIGTIHNIIGDEVLSSKNTTPSAYEI
ncbi:MAG: Mur ligase family protein, partial [bacterium]|nr:Mur ligase family protein [bacterium]